MSDRDTLNIFIRLVDNATGASQKVHQNMRQHVKQTASEQDKADKAYIRAVKLKERAFQDFAKTLEKRGRDAANAQIKADKEHHDFFTKLLADETKKAKQTASEQAKAKKDARRSDLQDMANAHKLKMMQWDVEQEAMEKQDDQWKKLGSSVTGYIAAFVGISAVVSLAHSLDQWFTDIKKDTYESAREMLKFRDTLKEIAVLTGHPGQTGPALMENFQLRSETFQSGDEANDMRKAAMSSGLGSIGAGLINKEEFEKHLVTAGKLSKMQNASPEAVGKLSGILPQMTGKKVNTAKDLDVLQDRLNQIQKLGGYTDFGQFGTQTAQSAEYVTKGVYDAPTMAALEATFARGGQGETAAERLRQATSAVAVGMIRNRGMKVDPAYEADYMTTSKYFKTLKDEKGEALTDKTRPEDIMMAVVKDLNREASDAEKSGDYFNPMARLLQHGFSNEQSREALAKLAGEEKQGGTLSALLKMAKAPLGQESSIPKQFAEHIKTDPTGLQAQAELADDVSKARRSMLPEATIQQAMEAAHAHQFAQGKIAGSFTDWQGKTQWQQFKENNAPVRLDDGSVSGYYDQVKIQAQKSLRKQADLAGIKMAKAPRTIAQALVGGEGYVGDEEFSRVQKLVQAAGGNPLGGTGDDVKELIRLQKEQIQETKRLNDAFRDKSTPAKPLMAIPPLMPGL